MKQFLLTFILGFICFYGFAQKSYHVFPKESKSNVGSPLGDGSLQNPWDLQTALNQKPEKVNGGDTIWLHNGIYNGRFISRLKNTIEGKRIVVSSYNNEWAVLNGNVESKQQEVMAVYSKGVTFQNFEVTWLGDFSRVESDEVFQRSDGINHYSGRDCEFINIRIHNNPGSGFGSWKQTGNAKIENCIIYKNGFLTERRGRGVGIYVQNASNDMRIIRGNIIFNNYYKGVEIWSASRKAKSEYVKNVSFEDNILFNSGLVSGKFRDNLIVATDDVTHVNVAKNIIIRNNIFYHNVSLKKAIENTEAPSLTLGFNPKVPIKDIIVENNVIIGRKDAIRFLSVESIEFNNNSVYSGYIRFYKQNLKHLNNNTWEFGSNTYYTRREQPMRIQSYRDYSLGQWYNTYGLDQNSKWQSFKTFEPKKLVNITKNKHIKNTFRVTLFNLDENEVEVDFNAYNLPVNAKYTIRDVEDYDKVLASGILSQSLKIKIPMQVEGYPSKTLNNFGVFMVSFETEDKAVEKHEGFFKRIIGWLGL
ncbi:right-handed parallel beta-helix repeat-containing protein [Hanstruepera flava]|uniref:right-handed parallel beta-helix repeat-containing protein n=1 Tax=Hanstruepera flava TaxID=2930218 RepID=UPI0020282AD4|nr:right-handed parallel beta-helix repeat-containing protein [Hanstruepera flava]